MERMSTWLADNPGEHSTRACLDSVKGKHVALKQALEQLEREDLVTSRHDGQKLLWTHVDRFQP